MTLVLDPDIRDWVVLPLFVIIIVTGLIRQSVSNYMNVTTQTRVPIPLYVQRVQSILTSSTYVRFQYKSMIMNRIITSSQQFQQYKNYRMTLLQNEMIYIQTLKDNNATAAGTDTFSATTTTTTTPPQSPAAAAADPMMDMMMKNPMSLMGNNMIFMVQNMIMMQGIQHFFSGFILLQVPFSLTIGFKSMFQKGVMDLPNLSSSYVSSVSWYFLVLYGLRSFLSLLIGTIPFEQKEQDMYVQQSLGYQNPPNPTSSNGKQDYDSLIKLLQNEMDHLELFMVPPPPPPPQLLNNNNNNIHMGEYDQGNNNVEQRLLGYERYPKKMTTRAGVDTTTTVATTSHSDVLFSISQSKSSKKVLTSITSAKKQPSKKIQ